MTRVFPSVLRVLCIQFSKVEDERIIELLERMEANQQVIIDLLREKKTDVQFDPELWKDSLVVQKILGMSRATLYRIRDEDEFTYTPIGKRTFYYLPHIFRKRNKHLK